MKRQRMHSASRVDKMDFDELYDQLNNGWEEKARRLQVRRWRALQRSMKGD